MAKLIRFPLEMANGKKVRTIEELRKNFDIESLLRYYADGRLLVWLSDRYYNEQVEQVGKLDSNKPGFGNELCGVLGVDGSCDDGLAQSLIKRYSFQMKLLQEDSIDEEVLLLVGEKWQKCLEEVASFQIITVYNSTFAAAKVVL